MDLLTDLESVAWIWARDLLLLPPPAKQKDSGAKRRGGGSGGGGGDATDRAGWPSKALGPALRGVVTTVPTCPMVFAYRMANSEALENN